MYSDRCGRVTTLWIQLLRIIEPPKKKRIEKKTLNLILLDMRHFHGQGTSNRSNSIYYANQEKTTSITSEKYFTACNEFLFNDQFNFTSFVSSPMHQNYPFKWFSAGIYLQKFTTCAFVLNKSGHVIQLKMMDLGWYLPETVNLLAATN